MHTILIQNLAKSFKKRQVVKDVSMSLEAGKVAGLLGPNGAGKTTCFYMIVGLIGQDSGQIFLNNQDISFLPMHKRAKLGLGYLPQEASVFRKMSVKDNIFAPLELREDLTKSQRKETYEKLLSEFGLEHVQNTLGIQLSGGERRRTEIARALAFDPKFILLDEPFAGVDPISVKDIKLQIKNLAKKGIGVLITDHNVRETLAICDDATIMSQGKVIANGTPETILANPIVREVYLGDDFSL